MYLILGTQMKKTLLTILVSGLMISSLYADGAVTSASFSVDKEVSQTTNTLSSLKNLNDFTQSSFNTLDAKSQQAIAKQYMLSSAEYGDYLMVKSNTFGGQYYEGRNMDPNFMLADYYLAKGEKERADHYIKNFARLEHDAVARLTYINAMTQLSAQMQFPTETPIKLKGQIPQGYTSYGFQMHNSVIDSTMKFVNQGLITSDATYVLIEDISSDDDSLDHLLKIIASLNNTRLDIYFLGAKTKEQIFNWAMKYHLGPFINKKIVTINFPGIFVSSLEKQTGKTLEKGMLFKDNSGNYKILDWSQVND
jgi:hypothetical protein